MVASGRAVKLASISFEPCRRSALHASAREIQTSMLPTRRTRFWDAADLFLLHLWNGQHFKFRITVHHGERLRMNATQKTANVMKSAQALLFEMSKQEATVDVLQKWPRSWSCPFTYRRKFRLGIACEKRSVFSPAGCILAKPWRSKEVHFVCKSYRFWSM